MGGTYPGNTVDGLTDLFKKDITAKKKKDITADNTFELHSKRWAGVFK